MAPPTPPASILSRPETVRCLTNEATSGRGSLTGKYKDATAGREAQAGREVEAALSWLGLAAGLATVSTITKWLSQNKQTLFSVGQVLAGTGTAGV